MTQDEFNDELTAIICKYLEAGACRGCLARDVFSAAISLAAGQDDIDVCWPYHLPESYALIQALTANVLRAAAEHARGAAIMPTGATLQ